MRLAQSRVAFRARGSRLTDTDEWEAIFRMIARAYLIRSDRQTNGEEHQSYRSPATDTRQYKNATQPSLLNVQLVLS